MVKHLWRHFFALTLIITAALACQLGGDAFQETERIPILTDDAVIMSQKLEQAVQEAKQTGTFTIEMTEQQLTSYVALNLAKSNQVPITNLQIRLRDDQIWINGDAQQDNIQLPLSVAVKVGVDSTGSLLIEFTSDKIGPFTLPRIMLDTIEQQVEKVFLEQVAKVGEATVIEEISIGEGSMKIRGTMQ